MCVEDGKVTCIPSVLVQRKYWLVFLGYSMGILIFCTVGSFHVKSTFVQVTAGNCKTVHNRLTYRLDIIDSDV